MGCAHAGLFEPVWSERILEEWARAARKIAPDGELQARAEIALLRANWPRAEVALRAGDMARLWLPDPNDIHVLAAAIAASADAIVTFNARDFPKSELAAEGVARFAPDEVMMTWLAEAPSLVAQAVKPVHARAQEMLGEEIPLRQLLKRARVPRLGKALG